MKIGKVSARILAARPAKGLSFGIGRFDVFSAVLVEVVADDGTVGYGEAMSRRGPEMTKACVETLLAPILVGKPVEDIEARWRDGMDQLRRWGHNRGTVMEAVSGVDIALWDLLGRAQGKPVYKLLNGAGRRAIPCYASSVYIADEAVMVEEARAQAAKGFSQIKIKIGRSRAQADIRRDLSAVHAIRDAVGPDIDLFVDANGAYDAGTAIRVARGLEEADVAWFEEPVPPDDREGYRRLRAMTTVPLATGETEFAVFGFRELVAGGLIDVLQPDAARSGGITGCRHAATLAYAWNKWFAPHTGFSGGISHIAGMHAAAGAIDLATFEFMFIDNPLKDIFKEGFPEPKNGVLQVPDGPGLGLNLDMDRIAEITVG